MSADVSTIAMQATGTFDVKLAPQAAEADVGDASIARLGLDKRFHGDLLATSRGQMLATRGEVPGSAGYVAMERVQGALHGRSGAFSLQHSGTMDRGTPTLGVSVVPDSGTDALQGLSGRMAIVIEGDGTHRYVFDYELPST